MALPQAKKKSSWVSVEADTNAFRGKKSEPTFDVFSQNTSSGLRLPLKLKTRKGTTFVQANVHDEFTFAFFLPWRVN